MDAHLSAGIAIYNAGGHHAAHDAWEDHWLELESGTPDERFLHGLIQFTAAVYHGYQGNWTGVQGLAESASEYLDGLATDFRGVNVGEVRAYLDDWWVDPVLIERVTPPSLEYAGKAIRPADLDFDATVVAAEVLAEDVDDFDKEVVADAVGYARDAVSAGRPDEFVSLLFDFVGDAGDRELIYDRLRSHVDRRRTRESDVTDVFDPDMDSS